MARHMVREVVRFGHWDAYIAANKAWSKEAVRLGMPAYRLFSSTWGTQNEAFFEADWESGVDIDAAFNAAMKDEAFIAATRAFAEHVVDGASVNYLLSEENVS
jgi:hypothetical protein